MNMRVLTSVLAGSLTCLLSAAWGGIGLEWELDRSFTPQPSSFVLTYRNSNDPGGVLQQFGVPWHPLAACLEPGQPLDSLHPNQFCTALPECLAPGVYTFWIKAVWPDADSPGTDIVSCEATRQCTCDQVASVPVGGQPVALPPSPPAPPAVPPPPGPLPPVVIDTRPILVEPPVFRILPTAPI